MRFHGHKNRNSILKTGHGRIHLYYGKSRDRMVGMRSMSLSLDWTAYRDIVGRKGGREEQRRDRGKEGKIALLGCH